MSTTTVLRPRESKRTVSGGRVLALICVAQFMVFADDTIVNVALPSIRSQLGFSEAALAWVVDAYLLFFGGFLLVGGRCADLFGRRRVFAWALAAFVLVSIACAAAPSGPALVVGRAAQGFAGAFVTPAAMATLLATFPSGPERTRALGAWGAMIGVAGATGVLLSGVITDTMGWRWVFLINVPIGVFALSLLVRTLPPHDPPRRPLRHLDLGGAMVVTTGLLVLIYTVIETHYHGWTSARTVGGLVASVVLIAGFVWHERRTPHPMVPARLVSSRSTVVALGILVVGAGALFSFFFFVTLYMQQVQGWTPLRAGLSWLPFSFTMIALSVLVMRVLSGKRYSPFLVGGGVLGILGFYMLGQLGVHDSYWGKVVPALMVVAAALAALFVPTTTAATGGVDEDESGIASGLVTSAQQLGGAIGLAALVTAASDHTSTLVRTGHDPLGALLDGFHVAFYAAAGLMAVITLFAFAIPRLRAPRDGIGLG